jgi:ferredoxin
MARRAPFLLLAAAVLALGATARADLRFPPPELPPWYKVPEIKNPAPRAEILAWVDLAVLAASLGAATFFALRLRSRLAMIFLVIFALGYFGFYRGGCVCPVGSIQDVSAGLFAGEAVPWVVLGFFLLPLLAALFVGRTFCAGACPLGAAQDLVLLWPMKVPLWLEHVLGLSPWVYLGAAATLAATGAGFLICRYDPFVDFYRLTGPVNMLIAGALVLVVAVFVGRPYCRFVCPYGAILRPLAALSWRHATITPAECVNCRLCEDACPYNAIQGPTPKESALPATRGKGLLAAALALAPILVVGGGLASGALGRSLARLDFTVRMEREARVAEYLRGAEKLTRESPLAAGGREFAFAEAGGAAIVRAFDANGTQGPKDANDPANALWQSPALAPAGILSSQTSYRGLALSEDGGTLWAVLRDRQVLPDTSEDVYDLVFLDARSGALQRREQYRLDVNLLEAYRNTGQTTAELAAAAHAAGGRFTWAARGLGAFLGLVVGLKLVHLSVRRKREFYQIDKARCVSCGRCFRYCPVPRGGLETTTKDTKGTEDTKR